MTYVPDVFWFDGATLIWIVGALTHGKSRAATSIVANALHGYFLNANSG